MFNKTTRGLLAALIAAALTLGSAAAQELTKIRMGYIGDYSAASVAAIANKLDMWSKHGLEAETIGFTNGPIQVQALGAGSLDFAYIGPGALWLPASGQAKVIAINVLGYTDRVITQPGIESIEDLKGKRVAVPEGTSGDMLLRLSLERAGMTLEDVDLITMDPSTIVSAFSSGQVDAAGIWYPFVDIIRNQVSDLNELASNEDFFPEVAFPSSFLVSDAQAGNEELIRKVVAVIKEASDYRLNNLDESVEITSEFLGIPAETLAPESRMSRMPTSEELEQLTADGSVENWLDTLADLYVQFGRIENPVPASEFYLGDFYVD